LAGGSSVGRDAVIALVGNADRYINQLLHQRIERSRGHNLLGVFPGALQAGWIVGQRHPEIRDLINFARGLDVVVHGAHFGAGFFVFDETESRHDDDSIHYCKEQTVNRLHQLPKIAVIARHRRHRASSGTVKVHFVLVREDLTSTEQPPTFRGTVPMSAITRDVGDVGDVGDSFTLSAATYPLSFCLRDRGGLAPHLPACKYVQCAASLCRPRSIPTRRRHAARVLHAWRCSGPGSVASAPAIPS